MNTRHLKKPKILGIWGNTEKPRFWELLPEIAAWAEAHNIKIYLTTRIHNRIKDSKSFNHQIIQSAEDFYKIDFLLCLGGDGTMLSAARAVGHRKTPLLGIHLGKLGFMAEVTVENMFKRLDLVAGGNYGLQGRMVLKCEVYNGKKPKVFYALNDFVIDRGKSNRILTMHLLANNNFVAEYRADGLIVSTPTGSTAYSLSSGGPIVMPLLKAIVITPICPHTLTLRPIVMPEDRSIEIKFPMDDGNDFALAVDGQITVYLDIHSKVFIQKAPFEINMIEFEDINYFQTLRRKMGWGRSGEK